MLQSRSYFYTKNLTHVFIFIAATLLANC
jgi:hypothetical protein